MQLEKKNKNNKKFKVVNKTKNIKNRFKQTHINSLFIIKN